MSQPKKKKKSNGKEFKWKDRRFVIIFFFFFVRGIYGRDDGFTMLMETVFVSNILKVSQLNIYI